MMTMTMRVSSFVLLALLSTMGSNGQGKCDAGVSAAACAARPEEDDKGTASSLPGDDDELDSEEQMQLLQAQKKMQSGTKLGRQQSESSARTTRNAEDPEAAAEAACASMKKECAEQKAFCAKEKKICEDIALTCQDEEEACHVGRHAEKCRNGEDAACEKNKVECAASEATCEKQDKCYKKWEDYHNDESHICALARDACGE